MMTPSQEDWRDGELWQQPQKLNACVRNTRFHFCGQPFRVFPVVVGLFIRFAALLPGMIGGRVLSVRNARFPFYGQLFCV